jgi:hypothetical protein
METWAIVTAVAQAISTFIAALAIYQTVQLHKKQMLLEQRQFLLPLWENLQKLNDINPAKPVWIDVIKAVNILELIAISWEGQLIDENIIRRMYSTLYIEFFQKIQDCKKPPSSITRDGKQMLLASPATIKLYNQLITEHADRNQLKPIGK